MAVKEANDSQDAGMRVTGAKELFLERREMVAAGEHAEQRIATKADGNEQDPRDGSQEVLWSALSVTGGWCGRGFPSVSGVVTTWLLGESGPRAG